MIAWRSEVERAMLISWLMKDMCWMMTNIYLGWCFGIIAVILHFVALVVDWPYSPAFRFYHISINCWVFGNLIWMTVEFMCYKQSSYVHFGPDLPVQNSIFEMSHETGDLLTIVTSWFFILGIFVQILLFALIATGRMEMPDSIHPRRDSIDKNSEQIHEEQLDQPYPLGLTMAFIENGYIILWTSKDYFWSWATGDFPISQEMAYFTEVIAISFGFLSVLLFGYITCMWRGQGHFVNCVDSLTCLLWLCADFMWMVGEIIIRYRFTQLDDVNQDNDDITRIISAIFFVSGLLLQLGLLVRSGIRLLSSGCCSHHSNGMRYSKLELVDVDDDKAQYRPPTQVEGRFIPDS